MRVTSTHQYTVDFPNQASGPTHPPRHEVRIFCPWVARACGHGFAAATASDGRRARPRLRIVDDKKHLLVVESKLQDRLEAKQKSVLADIRGKARKIKGEPGTFDKHLLDSSLTDVIATLGSYKLS